MHIKDHNRSTYILQFNDLSTLVYYKSYDMKVINWKKKVDFIIASPTNLEFQTEQNTFIAHSFKRLYFVFQWKKLGKQIKSWNIITLFWIMNILAMEIKTLVFIVNEKNSTYDKVI